MAGVFNKLSAALEQKPAPDGGTENKEGVSDKSFPNNSNLDKMKSLGLKSMPEDGQEGLDKMYSEKQKARPKYQRMYKD